MGQQRTLAVHTGSVESPRTGARGWRNVADSLAPANEATELIAGLSSR
jgi:hypothetical protein